MESTPFWFPRVRPLASTSWARPRDRRPQGGPRRAPGWLRRLPGYARLAGKRQARTAQLRGF